MKSYVKRNLTVAVVLALLVCTESIVAMGDKGKGGDLEMETIFLNYSMEEFDSILISGGVLSGTILNETLIFSVDGAEQQIATADIAMINQEEDSQTYKVLLKSSEELEGQWTGNLEVRLASDDEITLRAEHLKHIIFKGQLRRLQMQGDARVVEIVEIVITQFQQIRSYQDIIALDNQGILSGSILNRDDMEQKVRLLLSTYTAAVTVSRDRIVQISYREERAYGGNAVMGAVAR